MNRRYCGLIMLNRIDFKYAIPNQDKKLFHTFINLFTLGKVSV